MKCDECGFEKFNILEGVFFCAECNTQLQGTRDETVEVEAVSRRQLVSTSPASSERSFKEEATENSVWTTSHAYNQIICEQVSALIDLGASDKLKDVVQYIWSQYLQKCEVAFWHDDQSNKQLPRLSVVAKRRDIKVLYGDKSVGKRKKVKSKLEKKKPTRISKKSTVENMELSDTSESNKDWVPDDSSNDESCSMKGDELPDEEKISIAYSSYALNHKEKLSNKKKGVHSSTRELCVDYMTLSKTLCFCYLGLLYTEDQLLLSDLIRFAHEGRIPYLNASECLKSKMKLQSVDQSCFNTNSTPDLWQISLFCAKLIDFISLPKFKHPSLLPIIFRFVKDLNLPDNVVCIAKTLIDKSKEQGDEWYKTQKISKTQYLPIPLYEVQAMATIIVVLKMILVLDGKFEEEHSEVMSKINVILKDRKVFVWNQWKQQASLIEYLFMKSGSSHSDFSFFDSLNAAQIISKYPFIPMNNKNEFEFPKTRSNAFSAARFEIKEIVSKIRDLKGAMCDKPEPTSFPLKQQIAYLITQWKHLPMYQETKEIDFSFLSENFSSHQLFFKHSDGDTSDYLINVLLSSLYEFAETLALNHSASNCQNVYQTTSQYWLKNFSQKFLAGSSWMDALPTSFQWLLQFLCKYIKINCREMYCEVLNLEKKLFLHAKKVKS